MSVFSVEQLSTHNLFVVFSPRSVKTTMMILGMIPESRFKITRKCESEKFRSTIMVIFDCCTEKHAKQLLDDVE